MSDATHRILPSAIGLAKGQSGNDVGTLQSYLQRFGYLRVATFREEFNIAYSAGHPPSGSYGRFDAETEEALKNYQAFFALPVTGVLDDATVAKMEEPRCGFPDTPTPAGLAEYLAHGNRWPKRQLTYGFRELTPDLNPAQIREAIAAALDLWAKVTDLTFREVPITNNPDFVIRFVAGDQGDSSPFDGVGNVLAHAFYPPPNGGDLAGDAHFDESETWSVDIPAPNGARDLVTVAAHEFGHSLGLGHSSVRGALMFPNYSGPQRFLAQDDINGIRHVYPSFPSAQGSEMRPGEALRPNEFVRSPNGLYTFLYQTDANLVLYRNIDMYAMWHAGTHGKPVGTCIMQSDGNLVIYDPNSTALWNSETAQIPGSRLVVQDDGNVVIYAPDGAAVWNTKTAQPNFPSAQGSEMRPGEALRPNEFVRSPNGLYTFLYQTDANLVLYRNIDMHPLWNAGTNGKPFGICVMQGDGNLVVYDPNSKALWNSQTAQFPGSRLVVQNDGNVVIYAPDGTPVWASNTVQA